MKKILWIAILSCFGLASQAQTQSSSKNQTIEFKDRIIEVSCGECNFKLDGNGCSLAVRFDGKAYFVKGADINDYGDAHARDGFCNAVRKAKVTGKLVKNRFVAKKIEILPATSE